MGTPSAGLALGRQLRILSAALTALAFAGTAPAQTAVPPQIASVVSGGYWSAQGRAGTYRVVVVNHGFEHVASRVFIEWLADPRSPAEEPAVIDTVEPALPFGRDVASLGVTLKSLGVGRVRVVVSGVISVDPAQKVRAVITAAAPGVATVAKP
jgi:hypothetical protein